VLNPPPQPPPVAVEAHAKASHARLSTPSPPHSPTAKRRESSWADGA